MRKQVEVKRGKTVLAVLLLAISPLILLDLPATASGTYTGVYTLTTSVPGGHGTVAPATGPQPANSLVILTAKPAAGYHVTSWSGTDFDYTTGTVGVVTMTGNKTVSVTFGIEHTLTTRVTGGHGTLIPSTRLEPADTVVKLTAKPASGYRVKSWSGTNNDASTASTNTVTMSSDKTVTVNLVQQFTLTVTGGTGSGKYDTGTIHPITATVPTGYRFVTVHGVQSV